jgi:hypothetical protein
MPLCHVALGHALSFQPCSPRALLHTTDPTKFFLPSTLTLPGQPYMLFLASLVQSRRPGPSLLRSASARRRGRGTCPRPAARAPSSPRAPGPWVSPYKLAGRAAEAPGPLPLFAPTPRTCWSRLDVSRDSSADGGRTGPGGPLRRRRRGSRDSTAGGIGAGMLSSAPAPAPHFAPTPRTCWSQLDESRDLTAVRRAHGPG